MKVTKINWISEEAKEAEVFITDGKFNCKAFGYPCGLSVGDRIKTPLQSLDERSLFKSNDKTLQIIHQGNEDDWTHYIVARIIDKTKKLVSVGAIEIEVGYLPGDLENGDIVEFCPERLDIQE